MSQKEERPPMRLALPYKRPDAFALPSESTNAGLAQAIGAGKYLWESVALENFDCAATRN